MKRYGLVGAAMVLSIGGVIFSCKAAFSSAERAPAKVSADRAEAVEFHWRSGQPKHWRACLLRRP